MSLLSPHQQPHVSRWSKRVDDLVIAEGASLDAPSALSVHREGGTMILKVHAVCAGRNVCITLLEQRVFGAECTCEAYAFGGGAICKHGVRVLQAISFDDTEYVPPEEDGEDDAMSVD